MMEEFPEQDDAVEAPETKKLGGQDKYFWIGFLVLIVINLLTWRHVVAWFGFQTIIYLIPIEILILFFIFKRRLPKRDTEQRGVNELPENNKEWHQDKYFWGGFFGWFVLNGAFWYLSGAHYTMGIVCIPINLVVLIFFGFKQRMIARGLLNAFALNLIISIFVGTVEQATCFAPFFIDY